MQISVEIIQDITITPYTYITLLNFLTTLLSFSM